MIARALTLMFVLCLAGPAGGGETVVTGLSRDQIALNATFDGSDLLVFGAVRRDTPPPVGGSPLGVIVTVKGPSGPAIVRLKERAFGIWVNRASVRVRSAPSYYAIAATGEIERMISATERYRYGIGMDQAVRRVESHPDIRHTRPFAQAVVRLRERSGLYGQFDNTVTIAEETLFKTRFDLPSNIVEGEYEAEFFLTRDQKIIDNATTIIVVAKTGIERWLFNLAHERSLAYGILALAIALAAGWLAAALFRLIQR